MKLFLLDDPMRAEQFARFVYSGTWTKGQLCPVCKEGTSNLEPPLLIEWEEGSDYLGDLAWAGGSYMCIAPQPVRQALAFLDPDVDWGEVRVFPPERKRARRRRVRIEHTWNGSTWVVSQTVRYLYDGWRVIQERDGNNVPTVSYTRGHDLSGSLEGAGGIGGLLARSHGYSGGSWSTHNFYHADGGGNVTYLMTSAQGLAARYRYDPYGRLLSSSGPLAGANLYRFAGKEVNPNYPDGGGYYYYGYRFYDPNLQRWFNRDPLGEAGGINLYAFVRNTPSGRLDPFGLWGIQIGGILLGHGAPDYVFDAEVWGEIREGWHTGLDAIGALEPTPVADSLNALLYAMEGDAGNAGVSVCGLLPYAGDAAKAGRLGRKAAKELGKARAAQERAKNIAKDLDPKDLGPSGKPKIHTVDHPTRKRAKDAARNEGRGAPLHHPSDQGQPPHYHAVDECGDKMTGGVHHNYPKSRK